MPAPIIALFQTATTVEALFNYIDSGQVALSLGDIEMRAARAAFADVPKARDRRGHLNICIGHLNSARASYEHYLLSRPFWNVTIVRGTREHDANAKRRFSLALKAVCLRYLNEPVLCQEALKLADQPIDPGFSQTQKVIAGAYLLAGVATSLIVAEVIYGQAKGIGDDEGYYALDAETYKNLAALLESPA